MTALIIFNDLIDTEVKNFALSLFSDTRINLATDIQPIEEPASFPRVIYYINENLEELKTLIYKGFPNKKGVEIQDDSDPIVFLVHYILLAGL